MKNRLLTAVALTAMIAPGAALASDGWYGRAAVGAGTTQDIDVEGPVVADGAEIQSNGHIIPEIALGYGLADSGFRVELAGTHQYDDTGLISDTPFSDSDIHTYTVMGNVLYDFNEGAGIQPFVGAGAGVALQDINLYGPGFDTGNEGDQSLAWQLMAGLGYAVSEQLTAETYYRYLNVDGGNVADQEGDLYELDGFASHDIMFGLRYDFQPDAAPPPPPPPPPPPAPPPPPPAPEPAPTCEDVAFVVYFEWDQSFLTDQARGIISQAADRAAECGVASVTIEGHADRSGAASYNVGLSERRADAVEQELIAQGVAASNITTEAFGETQPAVETPDGVREPLNRRSEVVIRVTGATS